MPSKPQAPEDTNREKAILICTDASSAAQALAELVAHSADTSHFTNALPGNAMAAGVAENIKMIGDKVFQAVELLSKPEVGRQQ